MADEKSTVLGIRLDTEERKRFDEFVGEEGKNNKDFLNTLLNLYELNKGKVKNINLVGDIDVLESVLFATSTSIKQHKQTNSHALILLFLFTKPVSLATSSISSFEKQSLSSSAKIFISPSNFNFFPSVMYNSPHGVFLLSL